MLVSSVNSYRYSPKNTAFYAKKNKAHNLNYNKDVKSASVDRLLPLMAAMSGAFALSGCSEDFSYYNLNQLQEDCFESIGNYQQGLPKIQEKTFVLSSIKDSVYKENDEYKYNHLRIKSPDHTTVFGEILRKEDGKQLKFVNVYNKNDILESTTLKDAKTGEKYYISYEKGLFKEIHNDNGEELKGSKYSEVIGIFVMALLLGGLKYSVGKLRSSVMTDKYVPKIDPPQKIKQDK